MVDGSIFFKRRCALLAFDPDQSDTATLSTCAMRRDLRWTLGGATRGSGLAGAGKLYWFESVGPLLRTGAWWSTSHFWRFCPFTASIGPPSFRESNRAARRHGGFRKPLDQLWKRLVALYKKLVYGIARVGRWDA